jgi:hypothetical protein
MIDKERGLQLLGSGLKPVDVATTLGCDPSFISQWLMDDAFRQQVLALRIQNLQANTIRDKRIDTIEDELIERLQENIKWMTKPRDILMAFNIVNAAKRRGAHTSGELSLTQNIVTINLPPTARNFFFPKTNAQGEVIQVGEQVTITKPLQALMQERTALKLQERKSTSEDANVIKNSHEASTGVHASPTARKEAAAA